MRPQATLLALALAAAAPSAAAASLADTIRDARGACARRAAPPLAHAPKLDAAARALASGDSLDEALASAGYRAVQAATLELTGDPAKRADIVAKRGCERIADPDLTEFGLYERGNGAWIVLAAPFAPPAAAESGAVSRRVLALVNEARAEPRRCGRQSFEAAPPLEAAAQLEAAASVHSLDMAGRGSLAHEGSDGSAVGERVARTGYAWRGVGENIAAGQRDAEAAVAAWLSSPGHCATLMDARFTETGVAFALAPDKNPAIYWTQVFAAPR